MNPTQLLTHFDRLAEAPDAVARLRRFILDLAVRGKLVEQDEGEASAAKLLSLIETNKLSLIKAGAIRKIAELSPLLPDDAVFELPKGWVWERLGTVGYTQTGTTPPTSMPECFGGQTPFVTPSDLTALVTTYEGKGLTEIGVKHSRLIAKNSVLMVCIGSTIGKVNTVDREVCCNQQINTLTPFVNYMKDYVAISLRSEYFQRLVVANAGMGTLPILSKGKWEQLPIPIPPLAEQHRIVAKVDELMALCDQLEAAQQERERRRDRLAAASLQRLNQPAADATPEEQREHARFHLNHLPRLITRPGQIKGMRQLFLNLAVRGKLVEQDPKDDLALQLFKRIQSHKEALIKVGKLKNQTEGKELSRVARPYQIPQNWIWATFGSIMISRDNDRIPVSKEERNTLAKTYDYYGASGAIDKIDSYIFDKPLLLIGEDGANLISRSTPIAFIARGKYWVNNHAHVLDGITEKFLRYIELYINAVDLKPYVTGTAQPKMNQAKMNSILVALPPEDEQNRIVAKVDELMALCDKLEAQLTITQTDSRRLLEAVLA
jgi:type I restriction enzyme S subunit